MLKIFFILFIYLSKNLNSIKVKQNTLDLKFELKSVAIIIYFSYQFFLCSVHFKQIYDAIFAKKQFRFFSIYLHLYLQL